MTVECANHETPRASQLLIAPIITSANFTQPRAHPSAAFGPPSKHDDALRSCRLLLEGSDTTRNWYGEHRRDKANPSTSFSPPFIHIYHRITRNRVSRHIQTIVPASCRRACRPELVSTSDDDFGSGAQSSHPTLPLRISTASNFAKIWGCARSFVYATCT